jgi:serine/threonine protein kinase
MELCALSLEQFIRNDLKDVVESYFDPPFIRDNLDCLRYWKIFWQVTDGLAFIHKLGEIHRDLKPRNSTVLNRVLILTAVLLSVKDKAWKITDFGLTTEGTSRMAYTTTNASGTPCYRAFELVKHPQRAFTRNSDIWALGCILYELVFKNKAFPGDMQVWVYGEYKTKPAIIRLPVEERFNCVIKQFIYRMLELDWWR